MTPRSGVGAKGCRSCSAVPLVVVGLWIRMTIAESPLFREVEESHTKAGAPILEVLRRYPKQVLLAVGARVGVDVAFYTVLFITTYVATYLELPRQLRPERGADRRRRPGRAHPVLRQPIRLDCAPARLPGGRDRCGGMGLRLLRPARHRSSSG